MSKRRKTAIVPTRAEDYPKWYQQVIKAADLAESSPSRGCMIIKPWGYGIWENIKRLLDAKIKETGHENAYFPLFIPLSLLEKEAEHVEGFAKECAVVTHHRLEEKDGRLVASGELEDPLIVRPTSETIIGEAYSRWVQSWRDLPILINQWANVVRWEMRPRMFLRTAEFLWQEGHTVHATAEQAREEVFKMLEVYKNFVETKLAIPVIAGEKSSGERFPGAENSYSIEAMMQDGKALQTGTSHFLGQNFSRASEIRFLDETGKLRYAWTTSWGVSSRLIGALIMTHSDDNGLRLPPAIAPSHVVVMPILHGDSFQKEVLSKAEQMRNLISKVHWKDEAVRVKLDARNIRGGEKSWQWIKKGIPIRIEIGPRDLASGNATVYRRSKDHKESILLRELPEKIPSILEDIQRSYFDSANQFMKSHTRDDIKGISDLLDFFSADNSVKGFAKIPWSQDPESESTLQKHKLSIRCIPQNEKKPSQSCVLTNREATCWAIVAQAY